jgi:hypothetical protein
MDIIKHLAQSNNRDMIISLPKNKTWIEYLAHFVELQSTNGVIKILLHEVPKTASGNKCYVVFDGFLRGWLPIYRLTETYNSEICIELLPMINLSQQKAPMVEIEGFKYYFDNFEMQ